METRVKKEIPEEIHKEMVALPEFLRKLLFYRNIKTAKEAEEFLNPEYKPHDPFLMKGIKEAVKRFFEAVEKKERITIFADYDADGIPGAVVLHDFFKKVGYENFDVYIPDRHAEGFGLNFEAVKEIAKRGTKLIVTVDCGIADAKEVQLANELNVDVIITDHHTPTDGIPKAVAIVDPKQPGCNYPFKELCGAGVAFQFVRGLLVEMRRQPTTYNLQLTTEGWEKWLLDMVGIATLSDMVPLIGENRMFARYGLQVLRKSPRLGLGALFGMLRINRQTLSEDDIVFSISPRLNAASRMGDPLDAFKLLTTKDESEAIMLARQLEKLNKDRRGAVAVITKEIKHLAKERNFTEKKVIVVGNPNWKPALLGLVAGGIAEEFDKPVFLWGRDTETTLKGSCRSGGGIDVLKLMGYAKDAFIEFGGHVGAGGFSVSLDVIHNLENVLLGAVLKCGRENNELASAPADAVLRLSELDWGVISNLRLLAPFGEGNPKPVFLIDGALIKEVRRFGKDNVHIAIRFAKNDFDFIEAISFFTALDDFGKPITLGEKVSLLAHVEQSNFNGNSEIRLRIKEIL